LSKKPVKNKNDNISLIYQLDIVGKRGRAKFNSTFRFDTHKLDSEQAVY